MNLIDAFLLALIVLLIIKIKFRYETFVDGYTDEVYLSVDLKNKQDIVFT